MSGSSQPISCQVKASLANLHQSALMMDCLTSITVAGLDLQMQFVGPRATTAPYLQDRCKRPAAPDFAASMIERSALRDQVLDTKFSPSFDRSPA